MIRPTDILHIPAPDPRKSRTSFWEEMNLDLAENLSVPHQETMVGYIQWLLSRDEVTVYASRSAGMGGSLTINTYLEAASQFPNANRSDGSIGIFRFSFRNGQVVDQCFIWPASQPPLLADLVDRIAAKIYRFSPERFCAGQSPYGDNHQLKSDASNLPEVLSTLQPNPTHWSQYNHLVSRVLPQVRWIDVHPLAGNNEISVWYLDHSQGRSDLAIPLADCGTGIGHVLAILYVLFTSRSGHTVLIDEPQSFLHPGAARRLMGVLNEFPQHQLVVASHSPTIIATEGVSQILCLESSTSTSIRDVLLEDSAHRRTLLNELGARLADVYGAENIVWVEGPTEEECFPKILRCLAPGLLTGTAILAVRHTADIEKKNGAERIFEIYRALSSSGSLLPPTVAFVLDRECRSVQKLKELSNLSNGLLRTIDRRTFENYLLEPAAIAHVLNLYDHARSGRITCEEVYNLLESAKTDRKFECSERGLSLQGDLFLDAPRVLAKIFNEATECRVSFSKTIHSVDLTEWILNNNPTRFDPLVEVLKDCLRSAMLPASES